MEEECKFKANEETDEAINTWRIRDESQRKHKYEDSYYKLDLCVLIITVLRMLSV
jgi:hypothetical protein